MKMQEKIKIAREYMTKIYRTHGREWISPTEIGREINGGHSSVGSPVCREMLATGLVDRNQKGHYRLLITKE